MGWQIPSEDLTSIIKGKTEGNYGKQANILVAVPYCKGVVFCGQYTETLTSNSFAEFVRVIFP